MLIMLILSTSRFTWPADASDTSIHRSHSEHLKYGELYQCLISIVETITLYLQPHTITSFETMVLHAIPP
ncbi:hypothetical protein J2Y86_003700 [Pseudomonas migulae]|nr:hypothetical protein [Pseudomonas migulae]